MYFKNSVAAIIIIFAAIIGIKSFFSELVKVAISGVGAMSPKGTCIDCSDSEIKAVIEHMIK